LHLSRSYYESISVQVDKKETSVMQVAVATDAL